MQSRNIRRESLQLEIEFQKELERKELEIKRLRDEVENRSLPSSEEEEEDEGSIDTTLNYSNEHLDLSLEHLNLFEIVAKLGSEKVPKKEIFKQSAQNEVKTEYYLGQLKESGYINSYYSQTQKDELFTLNHLGRTALVDSGRY